MANQLFYPKSTFMYRIGGASDILFLPSPRNRVETAAVAGAATVGPVIESGVDLSKSNIKVGMTMFNVDPTSSLRGVGAVITSIDYATNKITISTNNGVVAGINYEIYENKPDPCVITYADAIDKNDIWELVDAEGNLVTWNIGAVGPAGNPNTPIPFQVTKILKTSVIASLKPIICMWN